MTKPLFALAVLLLAGSAKGALITGSVTAGFLGTACYQSQVPIFSRIDLSLDIVEVPSNCGLAPGPFAEVEGFLGPFSGSVTFGGGCFGPQSACMLSLTVEGDYYFAGTGVASFDLGAFTSGCCFGGLPTLSIDGQGQRIFGGNGPVFVQDIQLGEFHHIVFTEHQATPDAESFSYSLSTPGILGPDILPPPIPEPGAFLLCAGGLLLVGIAQKSKFAARKF